MDDIKRELASLRLDDEPPRSRRGAGVFIALLVFMVSAGTIFWWGRGVFAAAGDPGAVDEGGREHCTRERSGREPVAKTSAPGRRLHVLPLLAWAVPGYRDGLLLLRMVRFAFLRMKAI